MAPEPISVTSPFRMSFSKASTRTSATWCSFTVSMSVSSTNTSASMVERSPTTMITVGWKLCAPITTSPTSF